MREVAEMLCDVTFGQDYLADSFLNKMASRVKLWPRLVFTVG